MIPTSENIKLDQEIAIIDQPSYTYQLDTANNRVAGHVDGIAAVRQAIYKILHTGRYIYPIYSWNYGIELNDLFGKSRSCVHSELKRRIKEALLQDDRILAVDNFVFEAAEGDAISVKFVVATQFGEMTAEGRIPV